MYGSFKTSVIFKLLDYGKPIDTNVMTGSLCFRRLWLLFTLFLIGQSPKRYCSKKLRKIFNFSSSTSAQSYIIKKSRNLKSEIVIQKSVISVDSFTVT